MKKQLLKLSLVLTAVFMLSQVVTAQFTENYQEPVASVEVPEVVAGSISIDGTADATYSSAITLDYGQSGFEEEAYGAPDCAASFQIAYDDDNLYIFMDITDEKGHFVNESDWGNPWQFDCVEIFTDVTWEDGGGYEADGCQHRFCRIGLDGTADSSAIQVAGNYGDLSNIDWAWVDDGPTATQVRFEVSFAWDSVLQGDLIENFEGDATTALELGLEVSYIDSDGDPGTVGAREAILFWDEDGVDSGLGDGGAYADVTAFGVMKCIDNLTKIKEVEVSNNDIKYSVNGRTITFSEEVNVYNTLGQLVGQGKMVTVENAGIYLVNGIKLFVN